MGGMKLIQSELTLIMRASPKILTDSEGVRKTHKGVKAITLNPRLGGIRSAARPLSLSNLNVVWCLCLCDVPVPVRCAMCSHFTMLAVSSSIRKRF